MFNQAFQPPPPPSFNQNYQAHYSSVPSTGPGDNNWYLDSTATNRMTNDLSHLTINPSEYFGDEQVRFGDETSLSIQHTGGSFLSTTHDTLILKNLLSILALIKNLISVR